MLSLTDRYTDRIAGTLACFDRLILIGTLPSVACPAGLANFLTSIDTRIVQFPALASRLRDELNEHVRALAAAEGVEIEYVNSTRNYSKEARIQEILAARGDHPGLVHILAVTETCHAFRVLTHRGRENPSLKLREGKCKHYYFYFIDPQFGLCYLRVPTWVPFRLQFYCNGHSWLARQLEREGISFTRHDNAFAHVADWQRAQQLAAAFPMHELHQALDSFAQQFCPVFTQLGQSSYHWSILQAEWATDLVFHSRAQLQPLYETLSRAAILAVKAPDVAAFLGRAPAPDEAPDSRFQTQIEGTRIRHHLGPAAVKMYDKHGYVLRIETTINDVSFFKLHREVAHQNGTRSLKLAKMKKSLYSLQILGTILAACNRRYLDFLAGLDDPTAGVEAAQRLGEPVREHGRTYRGFNLFTRSDLTLFQALARGEWAIKGFSNKSLRRFLAGLTGAQVSRLLKRLRLHGYIKRFTHGYCYRLTELGHRLALGSLRLRELTLVPALASL